MQIGGELKQSQIMRMSARQLAALELMRMPALDLLARTRLELESNPALEAEHNDREALHELVSANNVASGEGDNSYDWQEFVSSKASLKDHLRSQLVELALDRELQKRVELAIESLDERGYLRGEEFEKIGEEALATLRDLEPAGVGARDLREALLAQITRRRETLLDQSAKPTRAEVSTLALAEWICEGEMRSFTTRSGSGLLQYLTTVFRKNVIQKKEVKGDLRELVALAPEKFREVLHAAISLIRSLDPAPGLHFEPEISSPRLSTTNIAPAFAEASMTYIADAEDLPSQLAKTAYVVQPQFKKKGKSVDADGSNGEIILVESKRELLPKLHINLEFFARAKSKNLNKEEKAYLKEKLETARDFIRQIDERGRTLGKICANLAHRQFDFVKNAAVGKLDYARQYLTPLTRKEIANELNLAESTISRALNGKFVEIVGQNGLVSMREFFSSKVGLKADSLLSKNIGNKQSISSAAVKQLIRRMIANEDKTKPLNDKNLCRKLELRGVNIARRTASKYRHELGIPPARLRK